MIMPSEPQTPTAEPAISNAERLPSADAALLALRNSLMREVEGIRSDARDWRGDSRKVRWTTQFYVWLVKGML